MHERHRHVGLGLAKDQGWLTAIETSERHNAHNTRHFALIQDSKAASILEVKTTYRADKETQSFTTQDG